MHKNKKNTDGDLLETAISIATRAHAGQTDKGGEPYILHPLRLMMQFSDMEHRMTAFLHDVIEDSDIDQSDLVAAGIPRSVIDALTTLTRGNESYDDYLDRVAANPIARAIKLADLQDNMRVTRLKTVSEHDLKRLAKYHRAYTRLSQIA